MLKDPCLKFLSCASDFLVVFGVSKNHVGGWDIEGVDPGYFLAIQVWILILYFFGLEFIPKSPFAFATTLVLFSSLFWKMILFLANQKFQHNTL